MPLICRKQSILGFRRSPVRIGVEVRIRDRVRV